MAKGEVSRCTAVGVFAGRDWERKAESEIPEKTISIPETSVSLQNPWKTKQENYGKTVNCRSTNLDFPGPQGHCQVINVYHPGIQNWCLNYLQELIL